jgi:hypothetical protein
MAITQLYAYPAAVNNTSTPPTKIQVSKLSSVVVDVSFSAAGDTTTTNVVHKFNLPVANGTDGTPKVTRQNTVGVIGAGYGLIIAVVDANTISVTKDTSATSTTGTTRLWIERPFSLTR